MLVNILQLIGSIFLVISFIGKNKNDFSNELKTMVRAKKIQKNDAFLVVFHKWIMNIGIIEITVGYLIALGKFSPFEGLLSDQSYFNLLTIYTLIPFTISLGIAVLIAKLTYLRFYNFVNSDESLRPGESQIWIGDLSGMSNDPNTCSCLEIEKKLNLLEDEIIRLKTSALKSQTN